MRKNALVAGSANKSAITTQSMLKNPGAVRDSPWWIRRSVMDAVCAPQFVQPELFIFKNNLPFLFLYTYLNFNEKIVVELIKMFN